MYLCVTEKKTTLKNPPTLIVITDYMQSKKSKSRQLTTLQTLLGAEVKQTQYICKQFLNSPRNRLGENCDQHRKWIGQAKCFYRIE